MNLKNKTLVITGAASGIGRALAIEAGRRGASLAIADINREGVDATLEKVGTEHCSVHTLDVSSLSEWQRFRDDVMSEHGEVDGIINNAGITFSGSVADTDYEQLERVMSINFMGMVYGTREFLPTLLARPEALIANVSSVFGLYAMKNQSAYCASKFAIRGYTEVLAQELKGSNVTVSTIHPGHIGTDIVENARREGNVVNTPFSETEQQAIAKAFKAMGLPPRKAATIILDGLQQKKTRIMVGRDAERGDRLSRLFPRRFVDSANKAAL